MEASIIGEFFRDSISKNDLVYSSFVGDGDSSLHATVKHTYPGFEVKKIECINHAIKNVNKKLIALSGPSKTDRDKTLRERRIENMDKRFNEVGKSLLLAARHYSTLEKNAESVEKLRQAILNIPKHAFGCHVNCDDSYCDEIGTKEPEFDSLSTTLMFIGVQNILMRPAQMASSFIECETSNIVECFMSVVAKYVEGKRKNLAGMGNHKLRIYSAVLAFNTTPFFPATAFKILKKGQMNSLWIRREQLAQKRRHQTKNVQFASKRIKLATKFLNSKGDKDYGDAPTTPDIDNDELQKAVSELKRSLQVDETKSKLIEQETRDKSSSELWYQHRRNRITASNAGKIAKLNDHKPNTSTVKTLLGHYKITGPAKRWLEYGKQHEKDARHAYELKFPEYGRVKECGLVISQMDGIFGASPDGLVGDDGLLEIKCPPSIRDFHPREWPTKKPANCPLQKIGETVSLKRNHDYFFQCVQQLIVTERKWCDFVS